MESNELAPWGRVDETGTVYVREASGERVVGQYPDGTAEEALAYFERKFVELAGHVSLLEQRAKRGAPANDIAKAVASLSANVAGANAVGNLAALQTRLEALGGAVSELTEKQGEEAKAAVAAGLAEREALVVEAETLAAADPAKAQWKQVTATLDDIFGRWQKHQQEGPRLPKNESNELWKRFRAARSIIDQHRKAFFAELDSTHKDARTRKQDLVAKAEALIPKASTASPPTAPCSMSGSSLVAPAKRSMTLSGRSSRPRATRCTRRSRKSTRKTTWSSKRTLLSSLSCSPRPSRCSR